jgi:hypothetical protein
MKVYGLLSWRMRLFEMVDFADMRHPFLKKQSPFLLGNASYILDAA